MRQFWSNRRIYFGHLLAVFLVGHSPPSVSAHRNPPGDIAEWGDECLELLVEEGRRQVDRQREHLERVRSRAQVLFALAFPVLGVLVAATSPPQWRWPQLSDLVVWLGVFSTALALLGAVSVMTATARLGTIDAALLSAYEQPVLGQLAADYAQIVSTGENTVSTRLTVFREATLWLMVGGSCAGLTFLPVWS